MCLEEMLSDEYNSHIADAAGRKDTTLLPVAVALMAADMTGGGLEACWLTVIIRRMKGIEKDAHAGTESWSAIG